MPPKRTSSGTSSDVDSARPAKPKVSASLVLRLQLSSAALKRFPSTSTPAPQASSAPSAPSRSETTPDSNTNATPPVPAAASAPPYDPVKRRGIPGPKPGSKRNSAAGAAPAAPADGLPRVRGKPGPKKKPRLEDGTIDHSGDTRTNGAGNGNAPSAPSRLGPKANQGAINAGLRALDRSGKPCRKWTKKGVSIKSFTGVRWNTNGWLSPRPAPGEETESETGDGGSKSPADGSEGGKENKSGASGSNGSEKSQVGSDVGVEA